MCELFALSSMQPATASFSLEEFARHGGISGPHKDGWGIAFYDGKDARVIRDTSPAGNSPYLDFIRTTRFVSTSILAHIRLATTGEVALQNCQPFSRELGGRNHLFAHNGQLEGVFETFQLGRFNPIGDTDSEFAFCYLMERLERLWLNNRLPTLNERTEVIRKFADQISPLGPANFIYSDGEYTFAHGHKRSQPGKEGYFPPGLHYLQRSCAVPVPETEFPGISLDYGSLPQEVALISSVPLSDENWHPFSESELLILHRGSLITPPAGQYP